MTTSTPTLNGQVLGQAERATRALLDRLLAGAGIAFPQWVAVNVTNTAGGRIDRADLTRQIADGLKLDEATVTAAVERCVALDLLAPEGTALVLTPAGGTTWERISAGIAGITANLYGDLPAEDLATAGRVLSIVTARANAALAA